MSPDSWRHQTLGETRPSKEANQAKAQAKRAQRAHYADASEPKLSLGEKGLALGIAATCVFVAVVMVLWLAGVGWNTQEVTCGQGVTNDSACVRAECQERKILIQQYRCRDYIAGRGWTIWRDVDEQDFPAYGNEGPF
jgi:hypothetical protein